MFRFLISSLDILILDPSLKGWKLLSSRSSYGFLTSYRSFSYLVNSDLLTVRYMNFSNGSVCREYKLRLCESLVKVFSTEPPNRKVTKNKELYHAHEVRKLFNSMAVAGR